MKKYIFLSLILLFILNIGYSNDSTNVELTKEVIYKDVKHVISQLADALKVGSEHVYKILVKQQVTNSIIDLCIYVFLILSTLIVGKLFFKYYAYTSDPKHVLYNVDIDESGILGVGLVGFVILMVITTGYIFFTITSVITGLINPEYGAIKEIIDMIKK